MMFSSNYFRLVWVTCFSLFLAACSSSGDSASSSDISLRFSDAPVDDVSSVVITVDQIIFNRAGDSADIIVESFTSDELGIEDEDTFTIDLLDVQGNDNRLVLDSVMLPVGEYQNMRLVILDEDINESYVDDNDGRKNIKVPSDQLKLGAFTVGDRSAQTFVVEFGLRQAMTYNPGPDRYILKPRGVRVVRLENASTVAGTVDLAAIHILEGCSDKVDASVGNVAYLYAEHNLDVSLLGDVFIREDDDQEDPEVDEDVAANIIAPTVATAIDGGTGDFLFSYLNTGDYTLAISCKAENDDPVIYDGIDIPLPDAQLVELTLAAEVDLQCDFPVAGDCIIIE
mgnify:FL=1